MNPFNQILNFIKFTLFLVIFYFVLSLILLILAFGVVFILDKLGIILLLKNYFFIPNNFNWFSYVIYSLIGVLFILTVLMGSVILQVWWERKFSAKIQGRMGPTVVNLPFLLDIGSKNIFLGGLLQPIADVIKLIQKEIIIPETSYPNLFLLSPILAFSTVMIVFGVVPFSREFIMLKDLNIGLFFIFAISSYMVISLVLAAWTSNNKYSLLGGLRTVAQMLSYEIPLLLSFLSVIIFTNSFEINKILELQDKVGWLIFYQPLMFIIFLWSMVAENNRAPFDLPEAESELVAGFATEYSSMAFALFYLAEYGYLFFNSVIISILFLGGDSLLPASLLNIFSNYLLKNIFELLVIANTNFVWLFLKAFIVLSLIMLFRWTYPRIRMDHLMALAWKAFIPITLINIMFSSFDLVISLRLFNGNFILPLFNWIFFLIIVYLTAIKKISLSSKYRNIPVFYKKYST
ncbi:MAG: complex I subunit 1/NuoH family protein [bacterium]|jgi:NADH-quinone oxidoreductase subunit H